MPPPWEDINQLLKSIKILTERLNKFIPLITPTIPTPAPTTLEVTEQPQIPPVEYSHYPLEWGQATGGSSSKLECLRKSWTTDMWVGFEVAIIDGTGTGQVRVVATNDRTSITPSTNFDTSPDRNSIFVIRTARAVVANKGAWTHGQKKVPTPGTAVQLDNVLIPDGCKIVILAKPGNTNNIYLGSSKADAESATDRFDALAPGYATNLVITNANLVWIDADIADEGISYHAEQSG